MDLDSASDPWDPKTGRMLCAGDSLGVFQSESPGMRQLLRGLKVQTKKDLAIALSLIRPGPASGGMKAEFIQRHVYGKAFDYLHPKMADWLSETYGVMLYQEDVMRIAVEVAGYTVAQADRFRSEVSKKVSARRLQRHYADFVRARAPQAGIDCQSAEAIWDEILRFAAYSYCKAHATVYGNIAWQGAYLKANYPQPFYCSLLNNHHGMYPLRVYVWDAKRHGVRILGPHVNHSRIEWSLEGKSIRAGLGIVKGLTYKTMQTLVESRRSGAFADLDDLRNRVAFRRPELQNLIHVGACDGLGATRPMMLYQAEQPVQESAQQTLFDLDNRFGIARLPDYDRIARLKAEIDGTGIPFSLHPAALLKTGYVQAAKLDRFVGKTVTVGGFLAAARKARTSDGRVMGFMTVEDATGLAEASFFPDKLGLYQELCAQNGTLWICGKVTQHLSSITIECSSCGKAA